jgi:hypothetical protein
MWIYMITFGKKHMSTWSSFWKKDEKFLILLTQVNS